MRAAPVLATRSLVAGRWREAAEVLGELHDPNTGEVRGLQRGATPAEVDEALAAADELYAAEVLEDVGVARRVAALQAWAAELDARADDIAVQDAISTGNPLRTARTLASYLGERVRSLARQATGLGDARTLATGARPVRLLNRALGPTLVLAPWNAPTFVTVSKMAAALGAGSPVILKPSEWTPGGAQLAVGLLRAVLDGHGLPAASAQLVHGAAAVGSALASDPRVRAITFTGGPSAGRAVARAAAETLAVTQLELGSNNPAIVMPDADLERTAAALVSGVTRLNGQWCEAPGKVLVPEAAHDALVDAFLRAAAAVRIGHCLHDATDLGPLAFRAHRDRLDARLDAHRAAGATVHRAGHVPDLAGWFFPPAAVTGLEVGAAVDELFGPALTIHPYSDVDEAVRAANLPGGGLDGFVFGVDENAAAAVGARIRAGEVRINGTHMADLAPGSEQSFWGMSGVGGHGAAQGVAFSQGRRVVGVDDPSSPI